MSENDAAGWPRSGWARALDIAGATLALALAALPMLVIAFLLLLFHGRPVIFTQERLGRGGRLFRLHKFRTLERGTEAVSLVTPDRHGYTSRLGRFLRGSRLDELPQLLDVLRGRMSLVGPRAEIPALAAEVPEDVRRAVLAVRPGLTSRVTLAHLCEDRVLAETATPELAYRHVLVPAKFRAEAREQPCRTARRDLVTLGLTPAALLRRRPRRECLCRVRGLLRDAGYL